MDRVVVYKDDLQPKKVQSEKLPVSLMGLW